MSKKRVCELTGVHPKSIFKTPRMASVKPDDQEVLEKIREVIKSRPTYGYKRVTALYNKLRAEEGLGRHNKKRIYRVMKANGLLLPKSEITRDHKPTGKVMTLHSNTRWSSDCFEIKCFNGEKVYVGFVIDTCDRECIGYVASSRPLQAEDIQALMLLSVENRFGTDKTPRTIEFLSDRGSIYRAHNTQYFAKRLGLKSCFTRAYSPQSNGMSEAFVKTIKRDYVYTSDCYDAATTIRMIKDWIEDYNQVAPHSALGMRSPMEYRLTR